MRLENNQQFPKLTASKVDGREMTLPDELGDQWGVLLFYRGHW
ncbi:MAG: hypothetical protein V3R29_09115 [Candidatus Acidoferrales bacterium]